MAHTSRSQSIIERSQGRKASNSLEQNHGGRLLAGLPMDTCLDRRLGMVPPDWALPFSLPTVSLHAIDLRTSPSRLYLIERILCFGPWIFFLNKKYFNWEKK